MVSYVVMHTADSDRELLLRLAMSRLTLHDAQTAIQTRDTTMPSLQKKFERAGDIVICNAQPTSAGRQADHYSDAKSTEPETMHTPPPYKYNNKQPTHKCILDTLTHTQTSH